MPRKIVARRSAIHGNGVFAAAPIAKGERIIEYKGRRRTHEEVDAGDSGDVDTGHTFLFTLNDEYVIDANFNNNDARWINHSCSPNCEAVLEEDDGDDRRKDKGVHRGDPCDRAGRRAVLQLRHHPGREAHQELKKIWECRCGSPNCTGTMLQPKSDKKKKKAAKKAEKAEKKDKKAKDKAGKDSKKKSSKD
jgi:hypothetical protein